MNHNVVQSEIENNIGTIIINRPEKRNSLTIEILLQIQLLLEKWKEKGNVKCVIFRGAGDIAFSSGYDILSIPTRITPELEKFMSAENPLEFALNSIKKFPYPTIAMLNGHAFGAGVNLAICCDIRIGAKDIKVGMPPAKLGIVYHPEGLKQFIEVIGMPAAREIFFTGRTYQGKELERIGIIDILVEKSELSTTTYKMAREISENAPIALRGIKSIFNMIGKGFILDENDQEEANRLIKEGFNSEDLKEGQTAFIEKRKPLFKNK